MVCLCAGKSQQKHKHLNGNNMKFYNVYLCQFTSTVSQSKNKSTALRRNKGSKDGCLTDAAAAAFYTPRKKSELALFLLTGNIVAILSFGLATSLIKVFWVLAQCFVPNECFDWYHYCCIVSLSKLLLITYYKRQFHHDTHFCAYLYSYRQQLYACILLRSVLFLIMDCWIHYQYT